MSKKLPVLKRYAPCVVYPKINYANLGPGDGPQAVMQPKIDGEWAKVVDIAGLLQAVSLRNLAVREKSAKAKKWGVYKPRKRANA